MNNNIARNNNFSKTMAKSIISLKEDTLASFNNAAKTATACEIITWALQGAQRPVVTTNFRPYEVVLLHACVEVKPDITVIWCDTGYNTPQTYYYAKTLIQHLSLAMHVYAPLQTKAYRDAEMGIPQLEDANHDLFTEQVKLEPFRRAMAEHKPDLWFTNIRKGQTDFRNTLDIISIDTNNIIKVSPFYYLTDKQMEDYVKRHNLPNEMHYFDPTKVLENRECGIHLRGLK